MSLYFWGIIGVMLVAAIAIIAAPLQATDQVLSKLRLATVICVPVVAVSMYAYLGSPQSVTTGNAHSTSTQTASVASLVLGLEDRLRREPDDADGWLLLARSFDHLGRHEEAIAVYEKARALGKKDVEFEERIGNKAPPQADANAGGAPMLRGRVAVTPDVAAQLMPGDTLFIFAKESRQHRMPVVALRKPASDLPVQFELSDAEVMVPGTSLVNYEQLVVTARISRTGMAMEGVEGLETWSSPVSPMAGDLIELTISGPVKSAGVNDE